MQISDALAKSIRNEYLLIAVVFPAWIVIQYLIVAGLFAREEKGKETSFGFVVIYAYARFGVTCLLAILFCCANPIRILITRRSELADVTPTAFRILIFAVVLLPIPLAIMYVFFGRKIGNYLYHRRYYTGRGAYTVDEGNYRSAAEFRDELVSRDLFYNEDTRGFIRKLGEGIPRFETEYYPEATIMPVTKAEFDDDLSKNEILNPDSAETYPAYVYNAVLLLTEVARLKYVPVARYDDFPYGKMSFLPHKEDYYIECKILSVDGRVYAIIGVNQSMPVRNSFDQFQRPFYMLLSEMQDITTFYEGKYYPHGAIYNQSGGFEMLPNTREQSFGYPGKPVNYPVRVVERVDLVSINKIAAELQDGVLKESIECYNAMKKREIEQNVSRES